MCVFAVLPKDRPSNQPSVTLLFDKHKKAARRANAKQNKIKPNKRKAEESKRTQTLAAVEVGHCAAVGSQRIERRDRASDSKDNKNEKYL